MELLLAVNALLLSISCFGAGYLTCLRRQPVKRSLSKEKLTAILDKANQPQRLKPCKEFEDDYKLAKREIATREYKPCEYHTTKAKEAEPWHRELNHPERIG